MSDVNANDGTEPDPAPDATPPPPPPPSSAPLPPGVPVAAGGGWGPPGEIRSWVTVALLTLVTCGIYGIFWQYYVFRDNKEHSGEGIGGGLGAVFAIFIGLVNVFLLPAEVGNIYAKAGQEKPVTGMTGFWCLIPIVGWLVWLAKVQGAINARWEQVGVRPA